MAAEKKVQARFTGTSSPHLLLLFFVKIFFTSGFMIVSQLGKTTVAAIFLSKQRFYLINILVPQKITF